MLAEEKADSTQSFTFAYHLQWPCSMWDCYKTNLIFLFHDVGSVCSRC